MPYAKYYFIFSLASIVIWYFKEHIGLDFNKLLKPITGMLYGVHGDDRSLVHANGPLWYFPLLVTSTLMAKLCIKNINLGLLFAFIYTFINYHFIHIDFPWRLDMAGAGAFFILIGYALNQQLEADKLTNYLKNPAKLIALLVIALCVLAYVNGRVNLNTADLGHSVFLYFLNAIIGSLIVILVSHLIASNKLAQLISTNTLLIFCIHIYFVKLLKFAYFPEFFITKFLVTVFYAICILLLTLIISIKIQPILKKLV